MPSDSQPTMKDIEPTNAEVQKIKDEISRRNDIRRRAHLPLFDVQEVYDEEVAKLQDDKFEKILKPYLRAAYKLYPGRPGVPSRFKQHLEVYRHSERALFAETGLRRPKPKPMNLVRFLNLYLGGKLPLA